MGAPLSRLRIALASALACAAASCATDDPYRGEPASRRWLDLGGGGIYRSVDQADLDDSFTIVGNLGWELTEGAVRPALEAGVGWSAHRPVGAPDDVSDVNVYRGSLGGRLTWYPQGTIVSPHVRAGGFLRRSPVKDPLPNLDQDGNGWYAGVGLDLWLSRSEYFTPFVTLYEGVDDDLSEVIAGVTFAIRY
jgi:hypothetical protein